jgi:delta8-fatty-acid desaturase
LSFPDSPELKTRKTIIYKGRRYDVTRWIARHPGGAIIKRFIGQDVTVALHMFHDMRSPMIQRLLKAMDVGPAEGYPVSAFDRDYLELEEKFLERGWFRVNPLWYVWKIGWIVALLVTAYAIPHPLLKGVFFGLFIQQSAFLAHDACHDSLAPRRWRAFASWIFADVCFAISYEDWTRQHNIHHLITNRPVDDPQINNMPNLVYSDREIGLFERTDRKLTEGEKLRIATQHIWFVPMMLLYGRINIVRKNFRRAWRRRDPRYLGGFAIHIGLWLSILAQGGFDPVFAFWFIMPALAVSGILHIQLLLSHIYAPRLMEDEQRQIGMKLQIQSNQNVSTTFLDDWFHGGLQHHIEHHLFPRLPRHNLAKARAEVRTLSEKHAIPYRSDPFLVCIVDMLRGLRRANAQLRHGRRLRARRA